MPGPTKKTLRVHNMEITDILQTLVACTKTTVLCIQTGMTSQEEKLDQDDYPDLHHHLRNYNCPKEINSEQPIFLHMAHYKNIGKKTLGKDLKFSYNG